MNPGIHILILTMIATAVFALVMAHGWVSQLDRRLRALEERTVAPTGTKTS